MEDIKR